MTVYVGNAFSLQMIEDRCVLEVGTVQGDFISKYLKVKDFISIFGHEDIARIAELSVDMIGQFSINRVSVLLRPGDELIVAQVGATVVPNDSKFSWKRVSVLPLLEDVKDASYYYY